MKTKFLLILSLTLCVGNIFAQFDNNVKDILAAANSGYANYIEKIPKGDELKYGFKDRNEFALAKIGKPYQIFTLNKEFFSDSILANKNYITSSNEWRISINVNNEPRVLITVAKMNGVWKVVGIGASGLANELGEFEKLYRSPNQWGMILRVYQMKCDFYVTSSDNYSINFKVFPLTSAKMILNKTNKVYSFFTLPQLLSFVKNEIKNNKNEIK